MTPMMKAALAHLPEGKGVFLRCDRGDALYVTNYPARSEEDIDWGGTGFSCRQEGALCFLSLKEDWIGPFEAWMRERVCRTTLTDAIAHAAFPETDAEDMALWTEGVKRMEMRGDAAGYGKLVRQRAAVCLREKRGGGTLIVCALMADRMNEGGCFDED